MATAFGGPESLAFEELELPAPGPHEVRLVSALPRSTLEKIAKAQEKVRRLAAMRLIAKVPTTTAPWRSATR